jgi:hypothetical protein
MREKLYIIWHGKFIAYLSLDATAAPPAAIALAAPMAAKVDPGGTASPSMDSKLPDRRLETPALDNHLLSPAFDDESWLSLRAAGTGSASAPPSDSLVAFKLFLIFFP